MLNLGTSGKEDAASNGYVPLQMTSPPLSSRGEASPRRGDGTPRIPRSPSKATTAGLDILQFTAAIYYLDEREGKLDIDVMRLGSMEGKVVCKYETLDASGKAGISYQQSSGTIVLEDGVPRATFTVLAVDHGAWAPTEEFNVRLYDPENCLLGVYLRFCRVKVLNDFPFPTTKFDKEKLQDGDIEPGFGLWREFCALNYSQPGMAWRTWFVLFVDQAKNLCVYFRLWFLMYLVDVALSSDTDVQDRLLIPGNRPTTILVMGIIWLLPSVLLHLWDLAQLLIGVKSKSVAFLQDGLFTEYLNFSEQSRSEILPSDMIVAVSSDCADVAGSYCTAMKMATGMVKIGTLATFVFLNNPGALWVMGFMPAITIILSVCRLAKQKAVSAQASTAEIKMMSLVNEVSLKYRLIADYMQRPYMNKMFSERTAALREKKRPESVVVLNNQYLLSFLGFFVVAVYIATSSMEVVDGEISLGAFLASITVFREMAEAFTGIYGDYALLVQSFEPLVGLTELYNKRTDLLAKKAMARKMRAESIKERARLLEERQKSPNASSIRFVSDLMRIKLVDVAFQYTPDDDMILENVTLSLSQGELVAIIGPQDSGRATLLRLISRVVQPTSGDYLVPSHLRVVPVSKNPVLMKMSLWENLAFGLPKEEAPSHSEWKRAREILELFHSPTLVAILDSQVKKAEDTVPTDCDDAEEALTSISSVWQERLTSVDTAIVHLARAFVMNPEVLVLQRPLSNFATRRAASLLEEVFMSFVDRKGLCLPEKGELDRRPRTLFFVPETEEQASAASVIWELEVQDEGVSMITMNVREKALQS